MEGGFNHDLIVFDNIESAYNFLVKLADAVLESKLDIESDLQKQSDSNFPRHMDALRLVLSNLERLETHVKRGRRVLNDLRSLRRLLFEERSASTSDVVRKGWSPFEEDETVLPFGWSRKRALSSRHDADPSNGAGTTVLAPWYVRTSPPFSQVKAE
jgi:hypothetical protein